MTSIDHGKLALIGVVLMLLSASLSEESSAYAVTPEVTAIRIFVLAMLGIGTVFLLASRVVYKVNRVSRW